MTTSSQSYQGRANSSERIDLDPLLPPRSGLTATAGSRMASSSSAQQTYGAVNNDSNSFDEEADEEPTGPPHPPIRAWSMHEPNSILPTLASNMSERKPKKNVVSVAKKPTKGGVAYYLVYALVNVIIGVPGLYGYAAVIFNHPVFQPHMNALSKLVLFSSLVHQLGFTLFSSLGFAIGLVQDAGLIFLSAMSNNIADTILERDDGSEEAVLSTTLVLLAGGTASLGFVLILMGRFRLADAVSYLPMPVVGGYLAFIGYFCLQAGVALCISKPMTTILDWKYLLEGDLLLLATPGLLAGLLFTLISRNVASDAALPAAMTAIPILFYVVIWVTGVGLEGAREGGWVGQEAPSVPVSDLFSLVDFSLVQWDLVSEIIFTWVGMVLVVSFASCLDVAAISMDMGEALDTNKELTTVGICNVMSGLTLGFTGSYIFSQTIFTYRTGVHSRWIGILAMASYLYIVISPLNILQVAPLFFLGSTLIFIGYDLVYEWLVEIRHKIFLSEYAIVWATFIAIHMVGMDAGIVIGVLVSLVDHVVVSASTTGVNRVMKKSRAVWSPSEHKLLQNQGYHPDAPKILTLEVVGTVFFGSSLLLFQQLAEETGISAQDVNAVDDNSTITSPRSPHTSSLVLTKNHRATTSKKSKRHRRRPKFIVLDLTQLTNLDASACRGCFLQFAKICAKQGITICASGPSSRIDWMLRSHDVAYDRVEEDKIKALFQAKLPGTPHDTKHPLPQTAPQPERILLFLTTYEALEFCESALLQRIQSVNPTPVSRISPLRAKSEALSLASVFEKILGASEEESHVLSRLDENRYHENVSFSVGDEIFTQNTHPEAFFVVLKGAVAVAIDPRASSRYIYRKKQDIVSGAGLVRGVRSSSDLLDPLWSNRGTMEVASMWPVGSCFGYVDFLLQRPRTARTMATQEGTVCAKVTHSHMNLLQKDDPSLDALFQRVLLKASILDLANCTCDE